MSEKTLETNIKKFKGGAPPVWMQKLEVLAPDLHTKICLCVANEEAIREQDVKSCVEAISSARRLQAKEFAKRYLKQQNH